MVLSSSGPPGPNRPKSSSNCPPLPPSSSSLPSVTILSPTPSKPLTGWFSLLASPAPSPVLQMPPTATSAAVLPAHCLAATLTQPPVTSRSNLTDNHSIVTDISSAPRVGLAEDPWARAHARVCAHASQECAACSISLTCCSCRSLRYTPGPPPSSPATAPPHFSRSRSASPTLFRNVGNGSPPAHFDESYPEHDDEAYSRAFAEFDTCDNISCVRGTNEPASWTIIVEHFDEGSEEFYDRTFRACDACNRACKKSFMSYKIKARRFDNTAEVPPAAPPYAAPSAPPRAVTPVASSESFHETFHVSAPVPTLSDTPRPPTPLQVFSAVAYPHRMSCNHPFATCPTCSLGIVCCCCNKLHTAPARLRLRCSVCSHFACDTCITPFCCSCRKPWFPGDSPTLILASRFRGGARSTKSSKKGSSSSSQSSGPGSLATAHSERNSPDPFTAPAVQIMQSSTDEIDAFADTTVKLSAPSGHIATARARAAAPSPSSNLPTTSSMPAAAPVFSRPVITGETEDVPTAVPSRAPSRAASTISRSSVGDAAIAELLQPEPFATPAEPPAFADIVGRIHRRFPLASLKVDEEDSLFFFFLIESVHSQL